MKDFVLNNWYLLLLGFLAVCTFVLTLISVIKKIKNKGNVFDSVKEAILENLPFWITISEGLAGGETKKDNVISLGIALVSKMMGRKLSAEENDYFVAFIGDSVEKILSTPQKSLHEPKKGNIGKYTVK